MIFQLFQYYSGRLGGWLDQPLLCCGMPGLFYSHSSIVSREAEDIKTILNHLMMQSDRADAQTDRANLLTGKHHDILFY